MRIAVTGASGFCGGHVARAAAAAGHDVVCVGRRPGPAGLHMPWDAAGTAAPDLAGADAVVHLAAAVGDPRPGPVGDELFRRVNVEGTARLMDAAAGRPVVYVSSASVYAPGPHPAPVDEDAPIGRQRTAYGRTKAAGELVATRAGAVALRPRAVYGPGDPHLLPRLLRAERAGLLLLPGPDNRLSLTAVENLAGACLAALDWPPGPYNIADAEPYDRDASIRAVLTAFGRTAKPVHVPVAVAIAAAGLAARLRTTPALTRYAVDQLAHGLVLDVTRAAARGYAPRRRLADFLADLPASGNDHRQRPPGALP
jgi:nucleoside-diphosphate-sugar epimerase